MAKRFAGEDFFFAAPFRFSHWGFRGNPFLSQTQSFHCAYGGTAAVCARDDGFESLAPGQPNIPIPATTKDGVMAMPRSEENCA